MPYITKWNLAKVYLASPLQTHITVRRLSGEFHSYSIVNHAPAIHTVSECERLKQPYGEKYNSGNSFVINYPVLKLNETSFDEIEGEVDDFTHSLYHNLGFRPCLNCWKIENIRYMQEHAEGGGDEYWEQHEKDLKEIEEFFRNKPGEHDKFLGLN